MGFVLESPVRVTRRVRVLGYVVLALAVVAGVLMWRASRPNLDPDTAARTAAGVTVVYTEDFDGAVPAIGYSSVTLRVLPGGCLGVEGRVPAIAVLANGTEVFQRAGQVAVRTPTYENQGNVVLQPGDEVVPGGIVGGDPVDLASFGGNLSDHVPAACRQYKALDVGPPYSS